MKRRRLGPGGWLLLATLLGQAGVARADENPPGGPAGREEAQRKLREGNRLFREGRYDEALAEYRSAFTLVPNAKLHFNIGVAERMRGNHVQAAVELDRFLDRAPDADPDLRADAERYLTELAATVATIRVRNAGAGSLLLVDGEPVDVPGPHRPVRLAPGKHEVVIKRANAPDWGRTLELAAGASVTIVPEAGPEPRAGTLTPAPRPPTPLALHDQAAMPGDPSGPRPIFRRWWFWTAIAGVAAAGLVTAAALWGGGDDACLRSNNCIVVTPAVLEIAR